MGDRLAVENVRKLYGPVEALSGVSLTVDPAGVHCLAGPNGSGKSTLFRLLLGLSRPSEGTVERPADGVVGAGFQEPAFYDSLTVAENIDVFGALSSPPDEQWVDTVIDVFALRRVRHRQAGELSGGFAKQLDLALALLKQPEYLLLDEPLADLDDVAVDSLLDFLAEYATAGNAVVITSHRIATFEPIIDRLTVLHEGTVTADRRDCRAGREATTSIYRDAISSATE